MSRIYATVRPSAAAHGVSTHDDAPRKESAWTPTVLVVVGGGRIRETVKRARGAALFASRDCASRSCPPPLPMLLLLLLLLYVYP